MQKLHEIRIRSDRFINDINLHITESIRSVDKSLLNMNKRQLLESKDSSGNPLIHKQTGSPNLSLYYSIKTKKQKPNLFLSGDFQRNMFFDINENNLNWVTSSSDSKTGILVENYGSNIFGIPSNRQGEAKLLTGSAFAKRYKQFVLKK